MLYEFVRKHYGDPRRARHYIPVPGLFSSSTNFANEKSGVEEEMYECVYVGFNPVTPIFEKITMEQFVLQQRSKIPVLFRFEITLADHRTFKR